MGSLLAVDAASMSGIGNSRRDGRAGNGATAGPTEALLTEAGAEAQTPPYGEQWQLQQ